MKKNKTQKNIPKNRKPSKTSIAGRRKIVLLGILLVLGIGFFFRFPALARSQARQSLNFWRIEAAESWLRIADLLGPTGESEFLRARIARLQGNGDAMKAHLLAAHKLGFVQDELNREQMLFVVSQGEIDPAIEQQVAAWIDDNPPDAGHVVDAYVNGLAAQSRIPRAAEILDAYEQAHPHDPMVNFRLAVFAEHLRNSEAAEKEFVKALEKDPKYFKAAWGLARIKSGKNSPQEAIDLLMPYDRGVQRIAVHTALAHCFQQLGDLDKSRIYFLEAAEPGFEASIQSYRVAEEVPERFLAASELGVLDTKLGNWEEAKKYLELALEANPRDFVARNAYAQTLRRVGLTEQAEKELEQIVAERKEYDKITVLRDQINQDQNNTVARVELGKILFKYESERFGLFWIRSALASDPNCKEAHQFLSQYFEDKAAKSSSSAEKQIYLKKASFHFDQAQTPTSSSSP